MAKSDNYDDTKPIIMPLDQAPPWVGSNAASSPPSDQQIQPYTPAQPKQYPQQQPYPSYPQQQQPAPGYLQQPYPQQPMPYQQQPYPQQSYYQQPQQPQIVLNNNIVMQNNVNTRVYVRTHHPSMLVRLLYFLFIGCWFGTLWLICALSLICTVIFAPVGIAMTAKIAWAYFL